MTRNALTQWARLLFGSLQQAGLREVIVSPGSRSTPFAWAALHTPGLTCRSVIDERSAAFFALGQARVTGRPSLVLCTSGSAAAQYFPAVVEASQSFLPLLLLTADRPFEVQHAHAAQSMDQTRLYGGFARNYFELGHPETADAALDGLRRMALHAYAQSLGPTPGPVQLNARARKPLEPVLATSIEELALEDAVSSRLAGARAEQVAATTAVGALPDSLLRLVQRARTGLIVCGPAPAFNQEQQDRRAVFELAAFTGFSLFAEATSQLRFAAADAPRGLRLATLNACLDTTDEHRPELILHLGAPATSGRLEALAADPNVQHVVVSAHGFQEPSNRAAYFVQAEPAAFARSLIAALGRPVASEERARAAAAWQRRDQQYGAFLRAAEAESAGALSEATLVRVALRSLPESALLCLGNSLPVRHVDTFGELLERELQVVSQRGINGIDGLLSGAIGSAASANKPGLLLLGDVSFVHDVSGLQLARELKTPFVVLVVDNAGGRIFDDLPLRSALEGEPELNQFWRTTPQVDFAKLTQGFGVRYRHVTSSAELTAALSAGFVTPGLSLIHASVEPGSGRALSERWRQLRNAEP